MYKKDDLIYRLFPPRDEIDQDYDEYSYLIDNREEYEGIKYPIAFLPHSCEEWIVGGIKELKLLRDDIDKAIKSMEQYGQSNTTQSS